MSIRLTDGFGKRLGRANRILKGSGWQGHEQGQGAGGVLVLMPMLSPFHFPYNIIFDLPKNKTRPPMKNITVIGAGTMGNGIAHTFAQFGYKVNLVDISEDALKKSRPDG
jgi:hypothetical protein